MCLSQYTRQDRRHNTAKTHKITTHLIPTFGIVVWVFVCLFLQDNVLCNSMVTVHYKYKYTFIIHFLTKYLTNVPIKFLTKCLIHFLIKLLTKCIIHFLTNVLTKCHTLSLKMSKKIKKCKTNICIYLHLVEFQIWLVIPPDTDITASSQGSRFIRTKDFLNKCVYHLKTTEKPSHVPSSLSVLIPPYSQF